MLTQIGEFLAAILDPLYQVGQLLGLTAAQAAGATGTGSNTMATSIFAVTLGPFVDAAGPILIALGDIVYATSNFLIKLSGLM